MPGQDDRGTRGVFLTAAVALRSMLPQRRMAAAPPSTATLNGFPKTLDSRLRSLEPHPTDPVALHELPHKFQAPLTGTIGGDGLCVPFLHIPECALSSSDSLKDATKVEQTELRRNKVCG